MRCREFERYVTEWVRGRVDAAVDARMRGHESDCAACAAEAAVERRLMGLFGQLGQPEAPVLWPRLGHRLDAPRRRPTWWRPAWIAIAAAPAAAAAIFLLWMMSAGPATSTPPYAGEVRLVRMAAEMEPAADPERDAYLAAYRERQDAAERVLIGGYDR
ncbi:MAG: hypothetical protein IT208_15710 [Chthonomonadales bacterium]|nr:hypothetical protein [Chthonomonadales bacterium]